MSDASIDADFAAIRDYLTAAREVLHSGHMPDIASLEGRVAQMCEVVRCAPEETHTRYVGELTALLEQLGAFEREMRARQSAGADGNHHD